jgi:hypothetical protein
LAVALEGHKIKVTKPLDSILERFNDSENNGSSSGHHEHSGSKSGEVSGNGALDFLNYDEEEEPVVVEEVKDEFLTSK